MTSFLEGLFDHQEYESLIRALVSVFDDLGGIRFVCDFFNGIFTNLSDRIWAESILPVFDNWPSVWAMVPDAKLAEVTKRRQLSGRQDRGPAIRRKLRLA